MSGGFTTGDKFKPVPDSIFVRWQCVYFKNIEFYEIDLKNTINVKLKQLNKGDKSFL